MRQLTPSAASSSATPPPAAASSSSSSYKSQAEIRAAELEALRQRSLTKGQGTCFERENGKDF